MPDLRDRHADCSLLKGFGLGTNLGTDCEHVFLHPNLSDRQAEQEAPKLTKAKNCQAYQLTT